MSVAPPRRIRIAVAVCRRRARCWRVGGDLRGGRVAKKGAMSRRTLTAPHRRPRGRRRRLRRLRRRLRRLAGADDRRAVRRRRRGKVDIASFKYVPASVDGEGRLAGHVHQQRQRRPHRDLRHAGAFDTGPLKRGDSKPVRLTKPGRYAYHCDFHPFMHGVSSCADNRKPRSLHDPRLPQSRPGRRRSRDRGSIRMRRESSSSSPAPAAPPRSPPCWRPAARTTTTRARRPRPRTTPRPPPRAATWRSSTTR